MNTEARTPRSVRASSEPAARTLRVLRFADQHIDSPFSLHEASIATKLPKATLLRIIRTLVDEGYLAPVGQRYESNVTFHRRLPVSPEHLSLLDSVLEQLAEETGQTTEVITGRLPDLYWLKKHESKRISVRVVARPGVTRSLYELDAPARLYLKRMGIEYVQRELVPGFFHIGPQKTELSVSEALELIEAIDAHGVEYDLEGNSNGIRRYVTTIDDVDGRLLYLLALAEPATPQNNQQSHLDDMVAALAGARRQLLERNDL